MVPNKIHPYNPELKLLARKLRKNMTLGEILLWQEELESHGIQFLRFEEREVRKDLNTVLDVIERWIEFNAI
ncbi:MAG: hypothetical protein EA390_03090 [Balneolaceae bacterium]|nr:MAG: hypothetical protein EA390_03090 [Balneolaceae bacterium]